MAEGHVHVIPVDHSLTPDEAWQELCIFRQRVTNSGQGETWATIQCDGEECALIDGSDNGS